MEISYWMSRISLGSNVALDLLMKQSILSIGYSELSHLNPSDIKEEAKKLYEAGGEGSGRFNPSWRGSIDRFLKMKVGDWVIVPNPKGKTFFVYEIDSVCMNRSSLSDDIQKMIEKEDLGFFYQVKPVVEDVSRSDYIAGALGSRLKGRQTTLNLTKDFSNDIKEVVKRVKENNPFNHKQDMLKSMSEPLLEVIRKHLIDNKFECLVQAYFKQLGASTIDVPARNSSSREEGDVDVIADFDLMKHRIYVQAKWHKEGSETDKEGVQQLIDYIDNNTKQDDISSYALWLVSSADGFSEEARKLAEDNNILLINGQEFTEMLINAGLKLVE